MSFEHKTPYTQSYASSGIDAGLQAFMRHLFNTMGFGLVLTGVVAFATANTPALYNAIFGTPLAWLVIFSPLVFIWLGFSPARVQRMPAAKVRFAFLAFCAVMGLSMATIFHVFTGESIARVFFVTAGTFSATALWGYTTKKDLTSMGSFLYMGMIGIFIAAIINLFLHSSMVHFMVSVMGVIIFTGLTAWDVQRLKESYAVAHGDEANGKLAVMGALSLYLNFINLFQSLIHLMGNRN